MRGTHISYTTDQKKLSYRIVNNYNLNFSITEIIYLTSVSKFTYLQYHRKQVA